MQTNKKRAFTGKAVLVTGASRGIGRAIALEFARQGADLVLAARSVDGLERVAEEARGYGVQALPVPTDVTDPAAIRALVAAMLGRFGRIDVLVNNAGIALVGGVEGKSFPEDVRRTLAASVFGMIELTRAALPTMRAQGSGAVVNMSSVMGRKAFARFGSYAIAMHAVSAFSDALRQELAGSGVRVSILHPALTATDLLREADEALMPPPFRRMTPITPEAVARAAVAAVRRGTPRVVVPAVPGLLLLGEALSPRLGDAIARALARGWLARLLGMSRGRTYHEILRDDEHAERLDGQGMEVRPVSFGHR